MPMHGLRELALRFRVPPFDPAAELWAEVRISPQSLISAAGLGWRSVAKASQVTWFLARNLRTMHPQKHSLRGMVALALDLPFTRQSGLRQKQALLCCAASGSTR